MSSKHDFAKLILNECLEKYSHEQSTIALERVESKNFLKKEFVAIAIGIFALLGICITVFDGSMIPACWQLVSIVWIYWRVFSIKI